MQSVFSFKSEFPQNISQWTCLINARSNDFSPKIHWSTLWIYIPANNIYLSSILGEGHGNPLHSSCLENLMDRGAWWAIGHRITKSWTRLKQLSTQCCFTKWHLPSYKLFFLLFWILCFLILYIHFQCQLLYFPYFEGHLNIRKAILAWKGLSYFCEISLNLNQNLLVLELYRVN